MIYGNLDSICFVDTNKSPFTNVHHLHDSRREVKGDSCRRRSIAEVARLTCQLPAARREVPARVILDRKVHILEEKMLVNTFPFASTGSISASPLSCSPL